MRAFILCFWTSLALGAVARGRPTAFTQLRRLKRGGSMERVVLVVAVLMGSGGAVYGQEQVWVRQFGGLANDYGVRVAADGGGTTYVAGFTGGGLFGPSAGFNDVFLTKYDAAGNQVWGRQLGTAEIDFGVGAAVDHAGNAYIAGTTEGSLFRPNAGLTDTFLVRYNAAGNQVWGHQLGTSGYDEDGGAAVDSAGFVSIAGWTEGGLGGPNGGLADVFLARYGPPACYANCDGSTAGPALNVSDFVCFLNRFAGEDPYANCDGSTVPPVLNVAGFICFVNRFAAGCP